MLPLHSFEMIRLNRHHTFTTTSSRRNGSAFAFQSNESEFKPWRGQLFFKFLQKFVKKEIRLGKMIFHYIDNECVISFFCKKITRNIAMLFHKHYWQISLHSEKFSCLSMIYCILPETSQGSYHSKTHQLISILSQPTWYI